jgi:O-antigen/teichoic acid export membrane protein
LKKLIYELNWIIFGQIFNIIGVVLFVRVVAYYIEPSIYGEFYLGMTLAALINQIVFGPLVASTTRYYTIAQNKQNYNDYYISVFKLTKNILYILFIIYISYSLICLYKDLYFKLVTCSLIYSIFKGYSSLHIAIQTAARERKIVVYYQLLECWLRIPVFLLLIKFINITSLVIMYSYILAIIPVTFLQNKTKHKRSHVHLSDHNLVFWYKKIWDYAWPMVSWGIFNWIQIASDKWALKNYNSSYDVGLYSILYQCSFYPIGIFGSILVQFVTPLLYHSADNFNGNNNTIRLNFYITCATLILTGILFFITDYYNVFLFKLFVGEKYLSVSKYLPWMVLASGTFLAAQVYAINLHILLKTKNMIFTQIITSVVGASLNIIATKYAGIFGLVISLNLYSIIYLIGIYYLSKKHK